MQAPPNQLLTARTFAERSCVALDGLDELLPVLPKQVT